MPSPEWQAPVLCVSLKKALFVSNRKGGTHDGGDGPHYAAAAILEAEYASLDALLARAEAEALASR